MSKPVAFLNALAQSLSTMMLYPREHPAWERALDVSFNALLGLQANNREPRFSFIGRDVVYDDVPLHEMRDWPWASRLAEVGIQRVEFGPAVPREEYADFLAELLSRLVRAGVQRHAPSLLTETPDEPSLVVGPDGMPPRKQAQIKFGALVVHDEHGAPAPEISRSTRKTPVAGIPFGLSEEISAVQWLQGEAGTGDSIPVLEADAVVRSLSVAMRGSSSLIVPLLRLKASDPYNAIHSINVATLTMALCEYLGMSKRDVHLFGNAALLHDIGMARVPKDLLHKPANLSDAEREIVERHPAEGARIIMSSDQRLELAAMAAYEHHLRPDGTGYPRRANPRPPQYPSRLVRVCSVYNALRIARAHRQPFSAERALAFIEERAGTEFDTELARSFAQMMRTLNARVADFDRDVAIKTPPVAMQPINEFEIHH
ncbi:MAG: HD domain-containing protein [Gemmatimonadaceae bacterium]|nr:HD domain-containing protein [Gemmatimonadaceae bacterium]